MKLWQIRKEMMLKTALTRFVLSCFLGRLDCENQKIITSESEQNVTLPCRAPNNNKPIIVLKWSRRDLNGHYVLMYRDQQFVPDHQHPSFKNRVDLQDRQMKDGDVSLILKNVMIADSGTYECRVVQEFRQSMTLISSIDLSVVDPPGQTGGQSGDEGEKSGPVGLIVGPSVPAVLVIVGVSAVFICRTYKRRQNPDYQLSEDQGL